MLPGVLDLPLPAWIVVAEAAESGGYMRDAFLERAVLAILGDVAAEIEDRAPWPFSRARGSAIGCNSGRHHHSCKHEA